MKRKNIALASSVLLLILMEYPDSRIETANGVPLFSQNTSNPVKESRLGLMLRRLNSSGIFMMATAHPDDEDNSLLTMLSWGQGIRTALVTATRGDGGQNEIGSELFDALAVLRTEELLAAHRFDGSEQYFTRAIDFGYSFSIEETFEKWGRQEILADFVRMIRTIRPDVITGLSSEGRGGGQHHQASGMLIKEAFRIAADPKRFPEQIEAGLRPWQAKKFYTREWYGSSESSAGSRRKNVAAINVGAYDSLLGRTYSETGNMARGMHKCQGMSQFAGTPGPAIVHYRLVDAVVQGLSEVTETSLFNGLDTTITGIAQYAVSKPNAELAIDLELVTQHAKTAEMYFFDDRNDNSIVGPVLAGLEAVRKLREKLWSLDLDDEEKFEIDFRLETKERQFEETVILAHGLSLEAIANDGLVTPGQDVEISAVVENDGNVSVDVLGVTLTGFDQEDLSCMGEIVKSKGLYKCSLQPSISSEARPTDLYFTRLPGVERYVFDPDVPFGIPFRRTSFLARFELGFSSISVSIEVPVQYHYEDDTSSSVKRMELNVVPRFTVRIVPEITVISHTAREEREVLVTVTNNGSGPSEASVRLELPSGWRTQPGYLPVRFAREDQEKTVHLVVVPSTKTGYGEYRIRAIVESLGEQFHHGYQVIEYPHTSRRHLTKTSETVIKVIDVEVVPGLNVGYVKGSGDEIPTAIKLLGANVEMIDTDRLSRGDLSRYNVIVTGIRAYEVRTDLRANNDRLMDYVENGGTLIVQYNKFDFNDSQYGPYPALVSRDRVTDESAPVTVLIPDHPMFTIPNQIDELTWADWVQERGLYFLGQKSSAYVDLVQLEDSFEWNSGIKRGALVEARFGDGRWIYLGLGLWRQLPAGTVGAYRLLANLISLGG